MPPAADSRRRSARLPPEQAHGAAARGLLDREHEGEVDMLWTVACVLVVLWILGLVTSYTMGGFIHVLLVLAVIVLLIRVLQGRSAV